MKKYLILAHGLTRNKAHHTREGVAVGTHGGWSCDIHCQEAESRQEAGWTVKGLFQWPNSSIKAPWSRSSTTLQNVTASLGSSIQIHESLLNYNARTMVLYLYKAIKCLLHSYLASLPWVSIMLREIFLFPMQYSRYRLLPELLREGCNISNIQPSS